MQQTIQAKLAQDTSITDIEPLPTWRTGWSAGVRRGVTTNG